TTTHHTKRARPPTNGTNRPPSRQNPGRPQTKPPITHESPPATRSAHSNHPQTMTAHHDKKRARPHTKNKEPPSLAPTNNSTKQVRTTTTAHLLQPP
ncbi:hypothetical protein K443DRAFT_70668, partial [Laccaria amethystina LaAM-08-1]